MPGNQNRGRKKKILVEIDDLTVSNPPKKRGRPKKTKIDAHETSGDSKEDKEYTSTHVSTLNKRSSALSKFYDTHLGAAIETFPPKRLPVRRLVLQRYRKLRAEYHAKPKSSLINTITDEVITLWERSSIPHKSHKDCQYMVENVVNRWSDARQDEKTSTVFQEYLNLLLDLRTNECMDLDKLEGELKASGNTEWKKDLDFFKGQMMVPQTGFMSPIKDKVLDKKVKSRTSKAFKAQLYAEKNKSDFTCTTSYASLSATSSTFGITKENIVLEKSRKAAEATEAKIVEVQKLEAEGEINEHEQLAVKNDPDWQLPSRELRRLSAKPQNITITLPSREIPTIMACASTATKTSPRLEMKLMSTVLKAGGVDINDASLSVSTIYRQRKKKVTIKAKEIRDNIKKFGEKDDEGMFVVMHWDGKIIQLLDGNTEDRLAIALSAPHMISGQFLSSPIIPDGTGISMANAVFDIGNEYGLNSKAAAMVFDTTASNTGRWKGSVTQYEKMVGKALLWLACRHHVPELHIKHANELLRGPSKGPKDPLFKKFKDCFSSLSIQESTLWTWPANSTDWRYERAIEVLSWADEHMENATWTREDYR